MNYDITKKFNFYGIHSKMGQLSELYYSDKECKISKYKLEHLLKLGIVKYRVPKGPILWLLFCIYYRPCLTTSLQFRPVTFADDTSIILYNTKSDHCF